MVKQQLRDIATKNLPVENVVRGSGSSYCSSNNNLGTVGVRVDMSPNAAYYFVATYHNFAEDKTDYNWILANGGAPTLGQPGRVIKRRYLKGPQSYPKLDCALIALDSTTPSTIGSGLFQGPNNQTRALRGTASARSGTRVSKFGMTTGLTYGLVMNLPQDVDPSYQAYIFFVQPCDKNGYPICGDFCLPGDSGAPVIDPNGYVLGLVVQNAAVPNVGNFGIINRIDQIESALGVTVHGD